MLASLLAAAVLCTIEPEQMDDDLYLVVCQGRTTVHEDEAAAFVERSHLGMFCKLYEYEAIGDTVAFMVYCE